MKKKIICVISARGGSKGLPNKNIKKLLNKPLIVWSIEQAKKIKEIDRVVVCTDSKKIQSISIKAGAEAPFLRPKNLSTSQTGKFKVFKYALDMCEKYYKENYEIYLDLDCTNPLRSFKDISNCISKFRKLKKRKKVDAVFTVCDARKNPYFNLLELKNDGSLKISKKLKNNIIRRQDAPKVFEHVASIYAIDPDYIKKANYLLDGNTVGYNIGQHKSLDIDSKFDYELIEFLLKKNEKYIDRDKK
jgi:CMP-N,N'-diacetyllegionaminic acid synthase|tara:strand:+ start:741 stop:1478 length:738 start_codon:yes stop_codon:yes gene_type:complete